MHIRLAFTKDIESITELGQQLLFLHQTFDPDYYILEEDFRQKFSDWTKYQLKSLNQFIIVAEKEFNSPENKKIVGFISGYLKSLFPWFKIKNVGHVSFLVVDQNFLRQGVAIQLEQAAYSWFKERNIKFVECFSHEKNTTGNLVWNNFGYKPFHKFLRKKIL